MENKIHRADGPRRLLIKEIGGPRKYPLFDWLCLAKDNGLCVHGNCVKLLRLELANAVLKK